jgi:transcriptional regulator with GAF, ATPase, and Fis domain
MFLSRFEHLEKRDLTRTIETQGDAANALLDEMNIRYNNALLIQEIGQATSTILDIDKLINTVVDLMEKHLDFDRGLIMLANANKTRLVYTTGYGYEKEYEESLRGTGFRLDNPKSKGVFVLAFQEQRPSLVNDIVEIEKNFKNWARLIQKIYEVDPLTCPKCQGRMRIIAFI